MSLEAAAKHLASKGRGPDTQLVHMSLGEVNSLQKLAEAHGGSLSINPETGLPEAGFLSRILPMIAGAALTATGVGAPMAALMIGGGTAALTGDLKQGLMTGLGAYGGAGLGSGLMGAGAATPEMVAQTLGTQAATGAGSQSAMLAAQNAGFGQAGLEALAGSANVASGAAPVVPSGFSVMGKGLTSLAEAGGRDAFMQGVGGMKGLLTSGAAGLAPVLMGDDDYNPPGIKPTAPPTPLQYSANPVSPTPQADVPGYGGLGRDFGRQQRYFNHQFTPVNPPAPVVAMSPFTAMPIINDYGSGMAAGGPVEAMSAANVYDMQNTRGGVSDMGVDMSTGMQKMARGGISDLGDYSDGGRLLRGPGDGVSDSIPAVIGRKRPARLADGEFVVPARIVSELGNGSTEAGARKLYAMMNRVQAARGQTTGKGRVAKNTRADKYLPA
jgi:hypothetical protein